MELQIELARPHGRVADLGFCLGEELTRSLHLEARHAVDMGEAAGGFEHLAGRAPASITPAEEIERTVGPIVVLEVLDSPPELADAHVPAVGVSGREVGEDPGTVDALPEEAVMGKDVVLVPGELLGEEPPDAALLHDLGQRGRIAEHVGQPHIVGLDSQFIEVEAFAVDDLADQRFARRNIAVGFDPHASGRLEPAFGDPGFHPLPKLGIVVAHPGEVLGLGDREPVLGIPIHELEHRAEGAGTLANCLA